MRNESSPNKNGSQSPRSRSHSKRSSNVYAPTSKLFSFHLKVTTIGAADGPMSSSLSEKLSRSKRSRASERLDTKYPTSTFSYPAAKRLTVQACDRHLFILPFFSWQKNDRRHHRRCSHYFRHRPSPRESANFSRSGLDQFLCRTPARAGPISLGDSRLSSHQRLTAHFLHDQSRARESPSPAGGLQKEGEH